MKKWVLDEVLGLFCMPFNDLLFKAQTIHRQYFNPNEIQLSTLYNIKTGSCPENCSYCSQSAHFNTGLQKEPLKELDDVLEKAREAKKNGASRFCMGAAWRGPKDRDLDRVIEMVKEVKGLGLETCVT
jgi:biotin synthase